MGFAELKKKWLDFVSNMNKLGVPLPLVRDPKTGIGSVSLTLVFISFNVVIVGLVGKWSKALDGIDLTQALNLFYACGALYFGRNMSSKNLSVSGKSENPPDLQPPP
jgi:hypothetical protein